MQLHTKASLNNCLLWMDKNNSDGVYLQIICPNYLPHEWLKIMPNRRGWKTYRCRATPPLCRWLYVCRGNFGGGFAKVVLRRWFAGVVCESGLRRWLKNNFKRSNVISLSHPLILVAHKKPPSPSDLRMAYTAANNLTVTIIIIRISSGEHLEQYFGYEIQNTRWNVMKILLQATWLCTTWIGLVFRKIKNGVRYDRQRTEINVIFLGTATNKEISLEELELLQIKKERKEKERRK